MLLKELLLSSLKIFDKNRIISVEKESNEVKQVERIAKPVYMNTRIVAGRYQIPSNYSDNPEE